MEITAEYLRNEMTSLKQQHANALAVAQQATGAIALIESLLNRLEQAGDSLTLEQLREGLGAKSAEIVKQ
jgi:predicted xylose isomerase-like sugar epimerase